jgi:hypothetical protein
MRTVTGGKVAITTNDVIGPYFATHKGVRQGDPFCPFCLTLLEMAWPILFRKLRKEV